MPDTRLDWPLHSLRQQLTSLLPGLVVDVVAETGSTNTDLLDRVRQHGLVGAGGPPANPLPACLLVAEHQTRGRGRQGKDWQSSAGASLTFSLALPLAPADWSGLSLAVGLALAEALDPLADGRHPPASGGAPRLGIKWPNDLLLTDRAGPVPPPAPPTAGVCNALPQGPDASPGRKLGGILIETVAAHGQRWAVVGVGLNVRPLVVPAGTALSWGAASLTELDANLDAPSALARVAAPLLQALLQFQQHGFAPLRDRFAGRDLLRGRPVSTTLPGLPQGVADGVDGSGTLWLTTANGRQPLASGEVSLRWSAPAAVPPGPASHDLASPDLASPDPAAADPIMTGSAVTVPSPARGRLPAAN